MSRQNTLVPGELVTASIAQMGRFSVPQLESLREEVRLELLHRRGTPLRCAQCGIEFFARRNARFCSGRCRVASFRSTQAHPKEKL